METTNNTLRALCRKHLPNLRAERFYDAVINGPVLVTLKPKGWHPPLSDYFVWGPEAHREVYPDARGPVPLEAEWLTTDELSARIHALLYISPDEQADRVKLRDEAPVTAWDAIFLRDVARAVGDRWAALWSRPKGAAPPRLIVDFGEGLRVIIAAVEPRAGESEGAARA